MKARIWMKDTKKMWMIDPNAFVGVLLDPNAVMYSTDLLDRKGKEIYEMDILRIEHFDSILIVKFSCGAARTFTPLTFKTPLQGDGFPLIEYIKSTDPTRRTLLLISVVGSVHENPEIIAHEIKRLEERAEKRSNLHKRHSEEARLEMLLERRNPG